MRGMKGHWRSHRTMVCDLINFHKLSKLKLFSKQSQVSKMGMKIKHRELDFIWGQIYQLMGQQCNPILCPPTAFWGSEIPGPQGLLGNPVSVPSRWHGPCALTGKQVLWAVTVERRVINTSITSQDGDPQVLG